MTLYLLPNGEILGGVCIDLSGIKRLTNMRHPQRSREAREVFRQLGNARVERFLNYVLE